MEEQARLERIINLTKSQLENAPEGSLRIGNSQGCTQYYHCTDATSHNGVYFSKKNVEFAKQLAQKSYNEKVLRYAEKTHMQITRLLKIYQDNRIEEIYNIEHAERQKLITPVEPTYEQKLEKWSAVPYIGKGFKDDAPVILTNSGLRVRSKSEKILADYFDSKEIPYKYECPLHLGSFGIVYPDFTFLSRKTGEEIYWEHDGMMDNPDYARAAVQKIELYEKNGIIPGDNLILTFETSTISINTELVKLMVQKYLM